MCQNSVFAKFGVIKNEVFEKKIAFFVFSFLCWRNRNRKKKKKKRKRKIAKKAYKNRSSKVVIQNVKNQKKMDF